MSNKSETDSEISMSVFDVRSSDEETTLANDRFSKADGYHAVPPPITGNFLTPRADISFADTVMSDSEDSTVTYTAVSSPFEDGSDIGSPGVDGPPIMPEDPYAYIMAAYQVPPSPDYIPGPEGQEQPESATKQETSSFN
ncbi:hypothetical protein Tco_0770132 [Tanacetum coccineum]|uniref:Uncharacterized protein n=1 Tax=Tanacetum coccineum TaxID=301880 RepID=A0ABQ4ZDW6_9ASTR